ncbi:MAG: pyridoxamine 5'-phosphate oxidase family protein [Nocardioidaceae bacterium]
MSGRTRVRMDPDEVDAFLRDSMKVQVATVNPDGSPHLTTLFYVVEDGRIGFWTYGSSQKIKNLERDPRITCLVESGEDYFELRGVSITGTAELVRDEDGVRRIGSAVASRMVGGADLGEAGAAEVERQVAKRVGVLVTPGKVACWDHAKMAGGR